MESQVLFRAAGERPFLHAREVVVVAVVRLPHRMHEREIGRRLRSRTSPPAPSASPARGRPGLSGVPSLNSMSFGLPGSVAAFQRHISNFATPSRARASLEAAAAQDGGFQRQLRREPRAHLLLGARAAGLVVEDGVVPSLRCSMRSAMAGERELALPTGNFSSPRISACSAGEAGAARARPIARTSARCAGSAATRTRVLPDNRRAARNVVRRA